MSDLVEALEDQVESLEDECERLAAENERLQAELDESINFDDLIYKMKLYGVWSDALAIFFEDYINYFAKTY